MKKLIIVLLCLSSFVPDGNATHLYKVAVLPTANDTIKLELNSYFGFGTPWHVPDFTSFDTIYNGNVLQCKAFYDASGAWETNFSGRVDTVNLGVLPANIKEIRIDMYTVSTLDTVTDTMHHPPTRTVFLPLTISEGNNDVNDISIYPNPNGGRFRVEVPLGHATGVTTRFEILNAIGQVMHREKVLQANGIMNQDIDMGDASAGVYLLRLYTGEGVLTQRFTVQ